MKYRLTKEQMDKENWKLLNFKFAVISASGQILSDDVKVEVKTTNVRKTLTGKTHFMLFCLKLSINTGNKCQVQHPGYQTKDELQHLLKFR